MHHFFKGQFFDFEVCRILGTAVYGGADVAEVLEAVGQIKDGNPDSWNRAWKTQAERALALAEEALKSGDRVAARNAYLRGSNYTRASGYMLTGDGPNRPHPRQRAVVEEVQTHFRKAVALMDGPVLCLDIPYQYGACKSLPAYLYLPPPERRLPGKIPILIMGGGADALQEELYYMYPAAGPDLGYAVLTFEGPGQGITLRRHDTKMRPDWEVVGGAVLDFIEELADYRPELELDTSRIGYAGASLGGYFALRVAADPRIKACVALDPLYSFWDFAMAHVSPAFIGAWEAGWLSDGIVDSCVGVMLALSFQMRWELSVAGTFFGQTSPARIMKEMKRYTLKGGYLKRIRCPVLVSGAAQSLYLEASHHTMRVYNELTGVAEADKELWMTATPGQGSLQAKMGALQLANQKTFKFLDEKLKIERPKLQELASTV
ncbi:alpha/beta hydrolase [Colletotrichum sublineola]|uniref:Putative alpha/beta hydrolase n=1 Tax=Colletotrichum sublineola TaxID=1173701 RepID=A0A066XVG6_COLSU|nr:alpha/beta hydrolase [Colletotrichum sublineola]KDN69970.1 putative alpha/beta hydrolase [Colletotrichum sublineola]